MWYRTVTDATGSSSPLISSLFDDLNISITTLAQDKAEDLRDIFSSWLSKTLSNGFGFKRLLCFEGFKKITTPSTAIHDMFRSFISLCKEDNCKIMVPLFDVKAFGQKLMLRLLVDSAIQWILVGLRLSILKLVVCSENLGSDEIAQHPLIQVFKGLKEKWYDNFEKERQKQVTRIKYDIYLSYGEDDEAVANQVKDILQEGNKEVRIYSKRQKLHPEKCWQTDICEIMFTCAKVITLLSPCFLEDDSCIEQYNIAMCNATAMKGDYLIPLYLDTIKQMPTYMTLIQYIDCRPADYEKITEACHNVLEWLEENSHSPEMFKACDGKRSVKEVAKKDHEIYDVFISYSHQNTEAAESIRSYLTNLRPHWKIFVDVSCLKTGSAWQLQLYSSIEFSKVVLALLSPSYIHSKICQDEYNLAFAMHRDASYDTKLLAALIEEVDELPVWCKSHSPLDCKELSDEMLKLVYDSVNMLIELQDADNPEVFTTDEVTAAWRIEHYKKGLPFLIMDDNDEIKSANTNASKQADKSQFHILISCHPDQKIYGDFIDALLKESLPTVNVSHTGHTKNIHNDLDDADLIIPLVSTSYMKSDMLSTNLNIAISRQRSSGRLILFPILMENLSPRPMYSKILWCLFACTDSHWESINVASLTPEPGRKSSGLPIDTSSIPIDTSSTSDICTDKARAACLYAAVIAITSLIEHPNSFHGSFKTLLNVEELTQSMKLLWLNSFDTQQYNNPLLFQESTTIRDTEDLSTLENDDSDIEEEKSPDSFQAVVEQNNEIHNDKTIIGSSASSVDTDNQANPRLRSNSSLDVSNEQMNQQPIEPNPIPRKSVSQPDIKRSRLCTIN